MALPRASSTSLAFDLSAFPFVLVRFPRTFDEETLAQLKAMQSEIFARAHRYVSIVDLRETSLIPNATIRREAGDWTKAQEPQLKRFQVANGLVFSSAIARAGLQAVHWFAPPPVPTIVTATLHEAAQFLLASAKEHAFALSGLALQTVEQLARGASA